MDIGDTILGFIQCVTAIGLNFLETAKLYQMLSYSALGHAQEAIGL